MKVPPCKDCEKRELRCHATCEEYASFKEKLAREKQKREIEKDVDSIIRRNIHRVMRICGK